MKRRLFVVVVVVVVVVVEKIASSSELPVRRIWRSVVGKLTRLTGNKIIYDLYYKRVFLK